MKIMIGTLLLAFPSKSKSRRRDGLLHSAKPGRAADYSLEQETETAAPRVPQSAASGAHSHRLKHKRAPVEVIPACQMAGSSVSRLGTPKIGGFEKLHLANDCFDRPAAIAQHAARSTASADGDCACPNHFALRCE